MVFLLVAGIVFLLAGLASIGFGVPVKEFSFGNTLILSGVIGGCTGAILVGLHVVGRQIRALEAVTAAAGASAQRPADKPRPGFPPANASEPETDEGLMFPGDRSESELTQRGEPRTGQEASAAPSSQPWQEDASRERSRARTPEAPSAPSADSSPKKRNLLFASTTRRDRERAAQAAADDAAATAPTTTVRSFEEAWPQPDRSRDEAVPRKRRSLLGGSDSAAESAPPEQPERPRLETTPPPRSEEMTEVTVLKSGVVDGMAYSLYSDGSIEAQMPEGMMRFESIDALREHLDQRS
ncbi:hypothetical protein LPW26_01045 [Rhodopseudomonas sp. HC1]|uniref:hypothetical protein n=1 Tax=Rhodopseudomonas infernalis TaxID=2897386 RepID=UPI001EE7FD4B|nr:hypothetical protein [Rhodopseudomonas infernalis]MCG6203209.1 hypothetical protein [Rhodopseudomonas infernalis]